MVTASGHLVGIGGGPALAAEIIHPGQQRFEAFLLRPAWEAEPTVVQVGEFSSRRGSPTDSCVRPAVVGQIG